MSDEISSVSFSLPDICFGDQSFSISDLTLDQVFSLIRSGDLSRRRSAALCCACLGLYPRLPLLRFNSRDIVDLFTPIASAISFCKKILLY